jgi:septal ring factor EnvC (AmiA/AmiB activator)
VVSYKVSIEQIQALQSSIEAAEQEISNKQKEDDELEDELDRIAAIKQREEAQKKLKFDLQSSVVKKSLPLPIKVTPDNYNPQNQIEELIYREM